jgi:hypothetical protein
MTQSPASPASVQGSAESREPRVWQSGGGRRIVLAFAFLLLLPFYVSLGPMLFQRASRGLVLDTMALLALALAFSALMALILQQLIHAVRTRVALDTTGINMTVPVVGLRGPFFLFRYATTAIPYADIAGVETRSEAYGGTLAPILLTSTRLTTKSGQGHVLGYVNANETEAQIPFTEIGSEIAARAGVRVIDQGVVHRSVKGRVFGIANTTIDQTKVSGAEIETLNMAHTRNLRLLVGALALLVVGGITLDFATASRASFAEMGAGLANPAKGAVAPPKKK